MISGLAVFVMVGSIVFSTVLSAVLVSSAGLDFVSTERLGFVFSVVLATFVRVFRAGVSRVLFLPAVVCRVFFSKEFLFLSLVFALRSFREFLDGILLFAAKACFEFFRPAVFGFLLRSFFALRSFLSFRLSLRPSAVLFFDAVSFVFFEFLLDFDFGSCFAGVALVFACVFLSGVAFFFGVGAALALFFCAAALSTVTVINAGTKSMTRAITTPRTGRENF